MSEKKKRWWHKPMCASSVIGVLYAEDFDTPELGRTDIAARQPQAEPVTIEPTFSLVDLQLALQHARQEERLLVRQEAERDLNALRTEALSRFSEALDIARSDVARIALESAEAITNTLLSAFGALLPGLSKMHGKAEAEALLRLLLPTMTSEPRLTVRAHPSLLSGLQADLVGFNTTESIEIEWISAEMMQAGDLTVRWRDGMMVRDTKTLCAEICAVMNLDTAQPDRNPETEDAH